MPGDELWVHGDGGPLILLQASAVPSWRGAVDWETSPMNGGSVETDYDVICRCPDGATALERHGREMLVLTDCSWAGCFVPSPRGEVVIAQPFGLDGSIGDLVARVTAAPPTETFRFRMLDPRVRLLPGADSGTDNQYVFAERAVAPGEKVCEVWYLPEAQIVVLSPHVGDAP